MKYLRKCALIVIGFALAGSNLLAQENKKEENVDDKRKAAMKKLDFLIGDWEGKGWIQIGRERKEFTTRESLTSKLNGKIVVVEGLGKSKDEKTGVERIVHNAYGIFSYNEEMGKLQFRFFREAGDDGQTTPEFGENTFVWGFEVPESGATIRFSERINEKKNWLEIGEVSMDKGKTWFKFFEMELSRIK